jgi:hypothetical protein
VSHDSCYSENLGGCSENGTLCEKCDDGLLFPTPVFSEMMASFSCTWKLSLCWKGEEGRQQDAYQASAAEKNEGRRLKEEVVMDSLGQTDADCLLFYLWRKSRRLDELRP